MLGEVRRGRRVAERRAEALGGREQLEPRLGRLARRAHGPGVVAQPAAHLADHGRHGVADEVGAEAGIEALERLRQAQRGGLLEVLDVAGVAVAARQAPHDRAHARDELLARGEVAGADVSAQQVVFDPAHAGADGGAVVRVTRTSLAAATLLAVGREAVEPVPGYRPDERAVKASVRRITPAVAKPSRRVRTTSSGRQLLRRARARQASHRRRAPRSSSWAPRRPDSRSGWRTVVRPMAAASSMSSKPMTERSPGTARPGARGRVEHAEGLHVGGREDGGGRAAQRQQLARELHARSRGRTGRA